jgi:heat shock protein HtpX
MWEQIRYNQTRTAILFIGLGAIWLLLGNVFGCIASYFTQADPFEGSIYGLIVASTFWIAICLFAYYFGDRILLAMAGARQITATDLHRISNVVEELQIASGLALPPATYVIEDPALNAFAVGRDPNKAAIIVTSGLLTKLNRDELQGVVGHEVAHIKNRDVLLMSLCATVLSTIEIVTWIFSPKRLYRATGMPEEGEGCFFLIIGMLIAAAIFLAIVFYDYMAILYYNLPTVRSFTITLIIIFLAIPAFMLLTPFLAKLIYYAVSRKREYLADASSALYTRYPEGLASALEKIANSTYQVLRASAATAPIYIVNPFREQGMAASELTSTHPPISERIRILRAMAHSSYAEYDRAYREIRGIDQSVLPSFAVSQAYTAPIRSSVPDEIGYVQETALGGILPIRAPQPDELDHIQRARETSNLLWNLKKYNLITCGCGTRMRLPPSFRLTEVKCPHCGKLNTV